jgi:mycothiol synthase
MLTWRALTLDDAPAVTRVYAAAEAVDDTGEHYSEQDVRDALEDESIDLGRDSLAAVDREVVAFAWVYGAADRARVEGVVLPAMRRRGVGRQLLTWAEGRAAERHSEGAICLDVHENNPGKEALARSAGYEATRWQYRMTRTLDGPLPDILPTADGFAVTRYDAGRSETVRQAHCEAFAGEWGATPPDEQGWSRWYTGSEPFRPDVSRLVLRGDEVVAYLLTYFWAADAAATGVREAYLGQLGVRPAWRRRGLGGLLLATGLHSYRAAGYERSSLTVDSANPTGALGLYERAGFAPSATSVAWMKPCAEVRLGT